MVQPGNQRGESFTAFRSAAEEAEIMSDEQSCDNEGGHMSSIAGRVTRSSGAMPYIVTLTHHLSDATTHSFATMRQAEAFIKRNTPVPGAALSTTYDRPAPELKDCRGNRESPMNDEGILERLRVIDQRLRQISTDDAAVVLATSLAKAGIREPERLRLVAETERILDELDANGDD